MLPTLGCFPLVATLTSDGYTCVCLPTSSVSSVYWPYPQLCVCPCTTPAPVYLYLHLHRHLYTYIHGYICLSTPLSTPTSLPMSAHLGHWCLYPELCRCSLVGAGFPIIAGMLCSSSVMLSNSE